MQNDTDTSILGQVVNTFKNFASNIGSDVGNLVNNAAQSWERSFRQPVGGAVGQAIQSFSPPPTPPPQNTFTNFTPTYQQATQAATRSYTPPPPNPIQAAGGIGQVMKYGFPQVINELYGPQGKIVGGAVGRILQEAAGGTPEERSLVQQAQDIVKQKTGQDLAGPAQGTGAYQIETIQRSPQWNNLTPPEKQILNQYHEYSMNSLMQTVMGAVTEGMGKVSPLQRETSGAIEGQIVEPPQIQAPQQAIVGPQGVTQTYPFYHMSTTPNLAELDPAFAGTGAAGTETAYNAYPEFNTKGVFLYHPGVEPESPVEQKSANVYTGQVSGRFLTADSPDRQQIENEAINLVASQPEKYGTANNVAENAAFQHIAQQKGYSGMVTPQGIKYWGKVAVQPDVTQTAFRQSVKTGGVTIDLKGNQPATGYVFSPSKDTETIISTKNFSPEGIQEFINQNQALLSQPGNHVGIWKEGRNYYLDVSTVANGPVSDIIKQAENAGQLAIYHLDSGQTIYTHLSPDYEKTSSLIEPRATSGTNLPAGPTGPPATTQTTQIPGQEGYLPGYNGRSGTVTPQPVQEVTPLTALSNLGKLTNLDPNDIIKQAQLDASYIDPQGVRRMVGEKYVALRKQYESQSWQQYKQAANDFYESLQPKYHIGDIVEVQRYSAPYDLQVQDKNGNFTAVPQPESYSQPEKLKITGVSFDTTKTTDNIIRTGFPQTFRFQNLETVNSNGEIVNLYSKDLVNGEKLSSTIKLNPQDVLKEFINLQKNTKIEAQQQPAQEVIADLTTPQAQQELTQEYQKGIQNKAPLDNLLNQVAQTTGARVETNLKNPDTAIDKVISKREEGRNYNISDVNDVVRGRLIYPDKGTLYQGVDYVKSQAIEAGWKVDKEQDFFKKPDKNGYQGYHIDLTSPNGQVVEVQLHTEKSLAASLATHSIHEEFEKTPPPEIAKQQSALNHEIMDMPNPQAKAISDEVQAKNAPKMAEAQANAVAVAQGQPAPVVEEKLTQEEADKTFGTETKQQVPPQNNGLALGLRDKYLEVYNRLIEPTPAEYDVGRNMTKIVQGRMDLAKEYGKKIQAQVKEDLPAPSDRKILRDYLDIEQRSPESLSLEQREFITNTPENIKEVANQIRILDQKAFEIRQNANQDIEELESHMARMTTGKSKQFKFAAHRQILQFNPTDGGTPLIGTADYLKLEPSELTDGTIVYLDKDGKAYRAQQAWIRDIEGNDVQKYEPDAATVLNRYFRDTFRVKENTGFRDALRTSDLYENEVIARNAGKDIPANFKQSPLWGLNGSFVSPKMYKQLEILADQYKSKSLPAQVFDTISGAIRQSILYNIITHPVNEYVNGLVGAGKNWGPLGVLRFHLNLVKAATSLATKDADYVKYKQAGSIMGTLGRTSEGPSITTRMFTALTHNEEISKMIGKGVEWTNPLSLMGKINRLIVSTFDDLFRQSLYRTYEQSGMSTADAVKLGDKMMVDYGNTSKFEKDFGSRFLIFYPYLKGQFQVLGELGRHPFSMFGSIVTLAAIYAGLSVMDDEWKKITGNPDASIRYPGVTSVIHGTLQAPSQIAKKQIPSIVTQHINPIVGETSAQIANKNLRDVFNPMAKPIYNPNQPEWVGQPAPTETQARGAHLLSSLVGVSGPIQKMAGTKETPAEFAAGYAGAYMPHLPGHQAAPALGSDSAFNLPNAQPGTGLTAYKAKQDLLSQMPADVQKKYNDIYNKGQKLDENGMLVQSKRDQMAKANDLLDDPRILALRTAIERENATNNRTPLNPLYGYNTYGFPSTEAFQQTVLNIQSLPPGDPSKSVMVKAHPGLQQYYKDQKQYGQQMQAYDKQYNINFPQLATTGQPQVSDALQTKLDQYDKLPQGTGARSSFLQANPDVLKFFQDSSNYNNIQRAEMGYPLIQSGGGTGSSRRNYIPAMLRRAMKTNLRPASKIKAGGSSRKGGTKLGQRYTRGLTIRGGKTAYQPIQLGARSAATKGLSLRSNTGIRQPTRVALQPPARFAIFKAPRARVGWSTA